MAGVLDEIEICVPALRRYARGLTRNPDAADDLVQDCLERAIRKKGLWQPTGSVRAWLFRILLNVYRNDLRHRRRAPELLPIDGLAFELRALEIQPGRLALAETETAMQTLPPEQREALLLVAVEGFNYSDAAAVLGIPAGTLMSRLGRARATLRQLTDEGGSKLRSVK